MEGTPACWVILSFVLWAFVLVGAVLIGTFLGGWVDDTIDKMS